MAYVYLEMGSGARVLPPPCGEAVEPRRSRRGNGGVPQLSAGFRIQLTTAVPPPAQLRFTNLHTRRR